MIHPIHIYEIYQRLTGLPVIGKDTIGVSRMERIIPGAEMYSNQMQGAMFDQGIHR